MNIGIDARLYGLEHAGLGRYCMNLVDRLVKSDYPVHWTLFLNPQYISQFETSKNVTAVPSSIKHYSLAEQTQFLKLLNHHQLDLLHVPHFNVPLFYHRPFVVTIHDILWHQVRGGGVTTLSPLKYYLKYAGYKLTVSHAVHQSKQIFVPSNYVKSDILTTFPNLDSKKIQVTYEGVDHSNSNKLQDSKTTKLSNYILYVGSAYPHKNISVILKALKLLVQSDLPNLKLILVGSRSVFLDRIKNEVIALDISNSVIFKGYQDDSAVESLLKNSLCLVHPSKSEGFGLTGLEAMAAGTPVISSNATALPEIYSDAAIYFDPDDPEQLAQKINKLHSDKTLRSSIIHQGLDRVKQFSWDKMVSETIEGYRQALITNH